MRVAFGQASGCPGDEASYGRASTGPRSGSAAEVTYPRHQQTGGRAVATDQPQPPSPAAEALERLGRLSLRKLTMESLLSTVAGLAKTAMPGAPETSVTLLGKDDPTTVANTRQPGTELDGTQYERGHGPF